MKALQQLAHDMRAAVDAALREWQRCRWLRRHGNPDACPF